MHGFVQTGGAKHRLHRSGRRPVHQTKVFCTAVARGFGRGSAALRLTAAKTAIWTAPDYGYSVKQVAERKMQYRKRAVLLFSEERRYVCLPRSAPNLLDGLLC
jgi:hypothetical protein